MLSTIITAAFLIIVGLVAAKRTSIVACVLCTSVSIERCLQSSLTPLATFCRVFLLRSSLSNSGRQISHRRL